jgi:hypothetical protein
MPLYKGILEGFFETGTEGTIWSLVQDDIEGYDALVFLEEGDRIQIFNPDETLLYDGVIEEDHDTGWVEYPLNPGFGQPAALGMWIHWTQAGFTPDDWAGLFFHNPPLRAEVIRLDS